MNKNDLRFQKTEILIKSTYFSLKKHGSTVVKVKELCDTAMINKTTFYSHYETIEHLHKQVCIEFVQEILKDCAYIDRIQGETRAFVYSILGAFVEKMPVIEKLYGNDLHVLVNDAEMVLMEHFMQNDIDEDYELSIRFCIGGAFRLLALEKDPIRIQKTVELIEKILNP
jgi:AcrR family transcriptional regulator